VLVVARLIIYFSIDNILFILALGVGIVAGTLPAKRSKFGIASIIAAVGAIAVLLFMMYTQEKSPAWLATYVSSAGTRFLISIVLAVLVMGAGTSISERVGPKSSFEIGVMLALGGALWFGFNVAFAYYLVGGSGSQQDMSIAFNSVFSQYAIFQYDGGDRTLFFVYLAVTIILFLGTRLIARKVAED
jgi:hypothetical protein